MINLNDVVDVVVSGVNRIVEFAVPLFVNCGVWKVLTIVTTLPFYHLVTLCWTMFFMYLFAHEVNKTFKK